MVMMVIIVICLQDFNLEEEKRTAGAEARDFLRLYGASDLVPLPFLVQAPPRAAVPT
jgi:hypothetical protein